MVVSIAKVRAGKKSYYESELESYYLKECISQNKFVGQGAERWGINEQVILADNHAFHALFRGEHPQTGEPLIRGTNTERVYRQGQESTTHKAVRAYDLTFSPPKSVSIVEALSWADGDTQTAQQVWQCHERAVRSTLDYVEKRLLFTCTGAGGCYRERVDGVFALIHHNTSRPVSSDRHPDPQCHTHVLLFNAGVLKDGRTGAIDGQPLFCSHHRLGAMYRQKLQQELYQELGFSFRHVQLKKGWSFEIKGVPQSLIREFSQRRIGIEQALQGNESPKQVRKGVLATRKAKVEDLDRTTLLASWQETGRQHGFDIQTFLHGRFVEEIQPHAAPRHMMLPAHASVTRRLMSVPKPSVPRGHSVSQKGKQLKRKFLWLYATGKISRKTYLRVVEGRGLPSSRLGIDVAYATYKIGQAQRLYLYHKYGYGLPKGIPRTQVSINLAYATRQITAGQRLYLLHHQTRSQAVPAIDRKPEMKRVLRRMAQPKAEHLPKRRWVHPSILKQLATLCLQKQTIQPQLKPQVKRRPRPRT